MHKDTVETTVSVHAGFALDARNFIGIDLHSNNIVVCVLRNHVNPRTGQLEKKKVWTGKIALQYGLEAVSSKLSEFCSQPHVAVVESTYNWYGLADLFEARGWHLLLADPTTVKTNAVKMSNDFSDAEFLADRLRLSSLRTAVPLSRAARAFRDLVRLRCSLMQDRSRYSVKLINMLNNQLYISTNRTELDDAAAYLEEHGTLEPSLLDSLNDVHICAKVRALLRQMNGLSVDIELIEKQIAQAATAAPVHCHNYIGRLLTIKGCGDVLATVIASEIDDIARFPSARHFVSYCRLAPTERFSNGKLKGEGNAKNGNATLSWALTELANFVVRYNPVAKRKFDRLLAKHKKRVRAIRPIAAILARAIFHMLRDNQAFDIARAFDKLPQHEIDRLAQDKQQRQEAKKKKAAERRRKALERPTEKPASKAKAGSFSDLQEAQPVQSVPLRKTPSDSKPKTRRRKAAVPADMNGLVQNIDRTDEYAAAIAELKALCENVPTMSEGSEPAMGG